MGDLVGWLVWTMPLFNSSSSSNSTPWASKRAFYFSSLSSPRHYHGRPNSTNASTSNSTRSPCWDRSMQPSRTAPYLPFGAPMPNPSSALCYCWWAKINNKY